MSARNTFLAFLGGAAVGAVVAILFAPEKGEVTRRKIGKAAREGRDFLVDKYHEGRDAVSKTYHRGKDRVEHAYHDSRNKLAEAIHEGRELMQEELDTICGAAEKAVKGKK